jgi:phosphatidylinositol glycan class B
LSPMALLTFELWLLCLLIAFRVINCLLIYTAFDPDEYWQSLEVAHRIVFGYCINNIWTFNLGMARRFAKLLASAPLCDPL